LEGFYLTAYEFTNKGDRYAKQPACFSDRPSCFLLVLNEGPAAGEVQSSICLCRSEITSYQRSPYQVRL